MSMNEDLVFGIIIGIMSSVLIFLINSRIRKKIDLKRLLEHNEIYFKVVISCVFSIISLYFAFQMNTIAKNQTLLTRLESFPKFQIHEIKDLSDGTTSNLIEIRCTEGVYFNIGVDIITFLNIHYTKDEIVLPSFRVPLIAYFFGTSWADNDDGLILTKNGLQNDEIVYNLEMELLNNTNSDSIKACDISVDTYIRLSFRDIVSTEQTQYYKLNSFKNADRLTTREGESIFVEYDNDIGNGWKIDVADLNNSHIKELVLEYDNNSNDGKSHTD